MKKQAKASLNYFYTKIGGDLLRNMVLGVKKTELFCT
jgi:hypothetical protein